MHRQHTYATTVQWTGSNGRGTVDYRSYGRSYNIEAANKLPISGSADPAFRGDAKCWNPEDLFLASISACHQLWYLHLCADAGVVVLAYTDEAQGAMSEEEGGSGQFDHITLRPHVVIASYSDAKVASQLHHEAHAKCFLARSVNFEVHCEATITQQELS